MSAETIRERAALLLVGAAAGALLYTWLRPRHTNETSSANKPYEAQGVAGLTIAADALQDDILREQFTRNIQFFGEGPQTQVFRSFVVIVGLGVRALSLLHQLVSVSRYHFVQVHKYLLWSGRRQSCCYHAVEVRRRQASPHRL